MTSGKLENTKAEAEWLACEHAGTLARRHPRPRPPMRKWRLFGVACCRRVERWFVHPAQHALLDCAEKFADGTVTATELGQARTADQVSPWLSSACNADVSVEVLVAHPVDGVDTTRLRTEDDLRAAGLAAEALRVASQADWPAYSHYLRYERQVEEVASAVASCEYAASGDSASIAERRVLADLFRDVFGNPYRPVRFSPKWKSPAVVGVASAIYANALFGHLPVLADALEEAGCDNEQVLSHCRGPGPHARGCWVLDRLLGKK